MFRVCQIAAGFVFSMFVASQALAYGAQPTETVRQDKPQNVQIAQACAPRVSPQMAAAFGLPMRPPGAVRTCRT